MLGRGRQIAIAALVRMAANLGNCLFNNLHVEFFAVNFFVSKSEVPLAIKDQDTSHDESISSFKSHGNVLAFVPGHETHGTFFENIQGQCSLTESLVYVPLFVLVQGVVAKVVFPKFENMSRVFAGILQDPDESHARILCREVCQ
eukprot:scaffold3048_cov192-Amphora_coffeaeformis.AAC.4